MYNKRPSLLSLFRVFASYTQSPLSLTSLLQSWWDKQASEFGTEIWMTRERPTSQSCGTTSILQAHVAGALCQQVQGRYLIPARDMLSWPTPGVAEESQAFAQWWPREDVD